jgi:Zn-dependent protease with chaperone function
MAMDFFEHQEQARRKTGRLVVLFIVAVICTVVGVNLVTVLLLASQDAGDALPAGIAVTTLGVLAVIGIGTAVKTAQMSAGGMAVAEALGGKPIAPDTRDPDERVALNIVEEMAIASGLPVPPVYVLEEKSINAFAAGRTHKDSVIGLTRGCMRHLSRDELQGVVAHEFSHIFHYDTRLNVRLVAWLGGIFALSLIGQGILRSMRFSSSRKNGGNGALIIGLGLLVIGSIGYFFGRIIQSAVSRQREYLADASAVQYTRNPDGIAGALEKIARGVGSTIEAPRATEFSHFFFANGLSSFFATHPPPEERIRRIRGLTVAPELVEGAVPAGRPPVPGSTVASSAVMAAAASAGNLSTGQLDAAAAIIRSLPRELLHASHNPFDARAVVVGMLLADDSTARARQLARVRAMDARLAGALKTLEPSFARVQPEQRLPLLECCAASLNMLSAHQYTEFAAILSQVIGADGQVDRFEWIVRIVLRRAIERRGAFDGHPHAATARDMALVTSVLAYSGARDQAGADHAWQAARRANPELQVQLVPAAECTLDALDESLGALDRANPRMKRAVVGGCLAAVCADQQTTAVEAELLRAISAGMGVPMPPVRAEAG